VRGGAIAARHADLDLAAVDQLPVLSSLERLHGFCRAHGWHVEVVAPDGTSEPVGSWLSCRAAVLDRRRRPDAQRCVLRALSPSVARQALPHVEHELRAVAPAVVADLERALARSAITPRVEFLASRAAQQAAVMTRLRRVAKTSSVTLEVAYSIKTNPSGDALELARSCGCLAEAVSQLEVSRALAAGFAPAQIILNGPAKWWPEPVAGVAVGAVFCDSLSELSELSEAVAHQRSRVLGVRVRPPRPASRFGVAVERPADVAALARALARVGAGTELGVHMHVASSDVGIDSWFALCDWAIMRAAAIQEACGIPVRWLDLGGGWHPDDFVDHLAPALPGILATASAQLGELTTVVLEPGRALVQPTMALLTQVLDVRDTGRGREILVDASISEVADAARYPHPVLARDRLSGGWRQLVEGFDRVAGRSCMETDILADGLDLPPALARGDLIAIDQVGAYDTSKAYVFGRG
jgi:diaminopimelate decarboxylase